MVFLRKLLDAAAKLRASLVAVVALAAAFLPSVARGQCSYGWSEVGGGTDWEVRALKGTNAFGGPELYVGGNFGKAGGLTVNGIARWDGAAWSALGLGFKQDNDPGIVASIAVFDDGKGPALYAGGLFDTAGGAPAASIAKWDGLNWTSVGGGVSQPHPYSPWVSALEVFDDGSGPALYVGGTFVMAGAVLANSVARWDGIGWTPLGSGLASSVNAAGVSTMAVYDDGDGAKLAVGGYFTEAGGVPAESLAIWDGRSWTGFPGDFTPCPGWSYTAVAALSVFGQGSGAVLYVGGAFCAVGGVPAKNVAAWNGSTWSALGPGTPNYARALAVFDDGNGPALHAGGQWANIAGVTTNGIAKWDGTIWWHLDGGLGPTQGPVEAMEVFDNGSGPALYVGGNFQKQAGAPASYIAKWSDTGINEPPIIVTQPKNATVYVGQFYFPSVTSYSKTPAKYQWRKDGNPLVNGGNITGATTPSLKVSPVGTGDAGAYDVVVTDACGAVTSNPAQLTVWIPQPCPPDCNGDGYFGQEDLGMVLACYGQSPGCCDLDGDGDTDQGDLGVVLAFWNAPCP